MNWNARYWSIGLSLALFVFAACGDNELPNTDDSEPPTVESFGAEPGAITAGVDIYGDDIQGEVELSWDIDGATGIAVFANDEALDLGDCELSGESDGEGSCSLTHEPEETTTYRLETVSKDGAECVFDDDGEVKNDTVCASSTMDVDVVAPALLSLEREDDRFEAGEEFTVEYSVENAADWEIGIVDGEDLEACEVDSTDARCSFSGDDSGELTLRDIDSSITISGWAENGADDELGDVELGEVSLDLIPLGAPVIRSLEADPAYVAFGQSTELSWETEDSLDVSVTSDFDGFIDTDLSECGAVDGSGEGSCEIQFAEDAPELTVTFTAVAIGEEDLESAPVEVTVVLGAAPSVAEFAADPTTLPETGGDVELSWETENDPDRLVIVDDAEPANVILDTDDDTGVDACASSGNECDFVSDSLTVEEVENNTQFTLIASSPLGSDTASVSITIEGAPQITVLSIDGNDATSEPVVVDAESATFDWETQDTEATELHRAERPDDGCASPDTTWSEVTDFPGDSGGSYDISGLDMTEECFRLSATGEADQSASATFEVARHPLITEFDATPETVHRGGTVELSWSAPFAGEVALDVAPGGSVNSTDRDGCTDVDQDDFTGSCEVTIQPGSNLGDVTFSLVATGVDELESDTATTVINVGVAPTVDEFESTPATAVEEIADITLSWTTADGSEVVISDDAGEVYSTTDGAEVAEGSLVVEDVEETTSWTLEVINQFGSDSASTTTFFGPSVETFSVNGEDGLGGEVEVLTGDVDLEWTTSSTDDADLERADVPGSQDCADVATWDPVDSYAGGSASYLEADVVQNYCYRLDLSNDAGQSSSVTVLVREVPFDTSLETNLSSIDGANGGTVTIDMSFVGASALTLTALFYDADDEFIDDHQVCTENGLNSGSLSGDNVDEDVVNCVHTMDGECGGGLGCIGVADDPPTDTAYIVYEVEYSDAEGDGNIAVGDESENVDVE